MTLSTLTSRPYHYYFVFIFRDITHPPIIYTAFACWLAALLVRPII